MSDTNLPQDGGGGPDQTESSESSAGDFDAVSVFEAGELDLRDGADGCYKCSTCDTNCPVAAVDDDFPGPKFQGPEQWRLKRKADHDVDPSIMDCSNCMRCDDACPTGVPLSQMHNEARAEYVSEQMSRYSRTYWRNKLLANYRRVAELGSTTPRLTNFVMNNRLVRWLNHRLLGITDEREFPEFATQTFRSWWEDRGGAVESQKRAENARRRRNDGQKGDEPSDDETNGTVEDPATKRIAYFHGCYANYNTPQVAKALVRVFEYFGYEVVVPGQACSGTPMFANGMLDDARSDAELNIDSLADLVAEGYDIICSCTSCSMSLKQEYPELFSFEGTNEVSRHTYEALEYLRINENLRDELARSSPSERTTGGGLDDQYAYHAPCHARNQGLDRQAIELFAGVDGIQIEDVGDSCSGISGTYGWKAEKYDNSMAIGEEMFDEMRTLRGETGLTECPTCAMQMEHGTGYDIRHPLELLEAQLIDPEAAK